MSGEYFESPFRLCVIFALPFAVIDRTLTDAGIRPHHFDDGTPKYDGQAQDALLAALKDRGLIHTEPPTVMAGLEQRQ